MDEEEKIPFTAHLEELRRRLIICFIAVGIGFVGCFFFGKELYEILTRPMIAVMGEDAKMIYTNPTEAFFTYLKVSFLAGLFAAAPVIFYQFWMFVAPGLYETEKRLLVPILFLSTLFFVGGALFGYFFVFPLGYKFFVGFETDVITFLPDMRENLGFASKLLIAFGLVFEIPIIITFMAKLGMVTVDFLKKNRKYAILLFFVGAAILTPPDVVTQILMALPLIVLYEISIIGAKIFGKKPKSDAAPAAES